MVLGITAGCKVGTFHLWGAGSSHCHRGPGPQGNEAADPCSGPCSHPRPEPRHKLGAVFRTGKPLWPPEDRSIHRGRSMMLRGRCRLWLLTNEESETRGPWKNYPRSLGSWILSSRTSCLRRVTHSVFPPAASRRSSHSLTSLKIAKQGLI